MSGEPEKAIKYYRRAVLLDSTRITAWVLMGHAYLELKNGHAAIESYRRASGWCQQPSPFSVADWFQICVRKTIALGSV